MCITTAEIKFCILSILSLNLRVNLEKHSYQYTRIQKEPIQTVAVGLEYCF